MATLGEMELARSALKVPILMWLAASGVLTLMQLRWVGGVWGDVLYLAVSAGAPAVAWVAAVRCRGSDRGVGILFAAALTLTSLADFISRAIGWREGAEPEASVADVGWIATYVLFGTGLLVLLRRGDGGRGRDVDGLIDVAAVSAAGMIVVWDLAVATTLSDDTLPVAIRVLWGSYPVLDLALLALVLRVFVRDRTVAALLVLGGVGLWLASDIGYLAIANAAAYSTLLDAGWLWGGILIALAVVVGPGPRLPWERKRPAAAAGELRLGRILMALLPLLVPVLLELQWLLRGREAYPVAAVTGTVVLVALAFLRMARLASSARSARQALASQERYASALAANSSDAVVVLDAELRLVRDAPRLAALTGRPAEDRRGLSFLSLLEPEDREEAAAAIRRCLARPGQVFHVELRMAGAHDRPMWLAGRVVNLLDDPDVRGVVVNLHDISGRKRAEAELSHQALHDQLTGLANRALFRDRLDHALDRCARTGRPPAVIYLDVDGFKTVNDSLGHDLGDDLLRQVAIRLAAAVSPGDTVGRLGGDEFAILIESGYTPLDEATATADRVLEALREPVRLAARDVTVSASLGIAVGEVHSDSAMLLRDADVAMYRSKATGKNRWTTYRSGMRAAAVERLELETGLHQALPRGELRLLYQPVMDLRNDRVVGFEALLRWEHPSYGQLTPDRFIPLAEETGLIVPIGRWVLQEAAKTAARWQHQLGDGLAMAVNLSGRQLPLPELVDDVIDALTDAGLDPGRLVLEITETALVDDAAAAAARLRTLHGLGVRLAIDDFGTGYSSLSYLRHFPVDILKIDRTFVQAIQEEGEFPPVVRALIQLGRTLRCRTLAEGVEYDFQRTQLRNEGCDLAQGFLFARPLSRADAEALIGRVPTASSVWC